MSTKIYLGSFDDRVEIYPWNSVALSVDYLDQILLSEVLFRKDATILINDGYMAHSKVFAEALFGKTSRIHEMLDSQHVKILCRVDFSNGNEEILRKMVMEMADKIPSYRDLANDTQKMKRVDEISSFLQTKNAFESWPEVQVNEGFLKLLRSLYAIDFAELKLRKTSSDLFKEIRDKFEDNHSKKLDAGPRGLWESTLEGYKENRSELMELANGIYHFNFAQCLVEKCPSVVVNTKYRNTFSNVIARPPEADFDYLSRMDGLELTLPRIDYSAELFKELGLGGDLHRSHQDFLSCLDDFRKSKAYTSKSLNDSFNEFRYSLKRFNLKKTVGVPAVGVIGVEMAVTGLSFALANSLVATLTINGIGAAATLALPYVINWLKMIRPGILANSSSLVPLEDKVGGFEIDANTAKNHISDLPKIKKEKPNS